MKCVQQRTGLRFTDADLILVMERGEIVERGTHDKLYAKDGIYRNLCDMQNLA